MAYVDPGNFSGTVNRPATTAVAAVTAALIIALSGVLRWLTFAG